MLLPAMRLLITSRNATIPLRMYEAGTATWFASALANNHPSLPANDHSTKTSQTIFVNKKILKTVQRAAGLFTPAEDAPSSFLQSSAKSRNVWDCKGTRFSIQGSVREVASQRTTIILLAAADSFLCPMHYSILI